LASNKIYAPCRIHLISAAVPAATGCFHGTPSALYAVHARTAYPSRRLLFHRRLLAPSSTEGGEA
jgi:hypothetical protein